MLAPGGVASGSQIFLHRGKKKIVDSFTIIVGAI